MSTGDKSVSDYIDQQALQILALPSNLRYGQAIFKRGGVEFIDSTKSKIEAWVGGLSGNSASGGGQRRRVQLTSTAKGIKWHCTGNPKGHQIFCKHCVALAIAVKNKV